MRIAVLAASGPSTNGRNTKMESVMRFSDFEVDFAKYELRRSGTQIEMPPLVFDLLAYLLVNRKRVVTREELMVAVWRGTVVCRGAITQAIFILRKKLGDDARNPQILLTIPRRGYTLADESTRHCGHDVGEVPPSSTLEQMPAFALRHC